MGGWHIILNYRGYYSKHYYNVFEVNAQKVDYVKMFYLIYLFFSHQTEDEIEAYYRTKYGDSSAVERFGEGEEMSDEITQQGLLPGVK